MTPPGITFDVAPPAVAADPNRTDIALVVGLLPLAPGGAAVRQAIADRLVAEGWEGRADDTLTDVPVRVTRLEDARTLFDLGGRLDKIAVVRGAGLADIINVPEADARFVVNLDGETQSIDLPLGPLAREALVATLNASLTGVAFSLAEGDATDAAGLVATRQSAGAGALTVYANPTLGFPVAMRAETQATGSPTGAALKGFFAQGGAEAWIVRMGDPAPLFVPESRRVAALQRLIPGFGPGATRFADLATPPELPPHFPTRTPWHGLAHLHGLPQVAQVLIPDLPELVSGVPAVATEPAIQIRPPAKFVACAPQAPGILNGQAEAGEPVRATADGLALWSRVAGWIAASISQITPEAMAIVAAPLPDDGRTKTIAELTAPPAMTNRQLQVVSPWVVSPLFRDMPGAAAPADGLVAGAIAQTALRDGAWRTVAGTALPEVTDLLGESALTNPATAPAVTLLGRGVEGFHILSDRTTDPTEFAQANTRRLMALILRAARHRGEGLVFEANGEALWRDTRQVLTTLLRRLHMAGALAGVAEEDAFTVRCGRETMSQLDIDAGRVIAEVGFRPAQTIEMIQIVLESRGGQLGARVAA